MNVYHTRKHALNNFKAKRHMSNSKKKNHGAAAALFKHFMSSHRDRKRSKPDRRDLIFQQIGLVDVSRMPLKEILLQFRTMSWGLEGRASRTRSIPSNTHRHFKAMRH